MTEGEKMARALRRISVALVLSILAIGVIETAVSLRQTTKTIQNAGSIIGIGVGIYWNAACTNQTSSISWGLLEPGLTKTIRVYTRNEGNAAVTLSKATQNWSPSTATSYITLNWNYANQTLSVNQVLPINLTLVVSSAISGITDFSFDITITATG
jgi:hypothetical protein